MSETISQTLSEDLFSLLQNERFVTLATIDYETGAPALHSLSWAYAVTPQLIRFAVDNRSRILTNITKHAKVALHLIGAGSSYAIDGLATVKTRQMDSVPIKLAMAEMAIVSVRDIMFYGSRIRVEPQYEKTYAQHAAEKLDRQVMTALKQG
ncbi:pyridoxamine 5'-phosphate oxidase family protein [Brevibacillus sp. TJ4]|uniref:pyridoxamine 5'-phosphate oxidase family protein n=1 Tax=Brevibacillus sp. TJ4 TaxID=3234853 RepID=UPI0037D02EEB